MTLTNYKSKKILPNKICIKIRYKYKNKILNLLNKFKKFKKSIKTHLRKLLKLWIINKISSTN